MDKKLYTHDEFKNECLAFEQELLRRVFQDEYRDNLRLFDLIRHLEHIALDRSFYDSEVFSELINGLKELRFLIASNINGDKGERRARCVLEWLPIDHEVIYGLQLVCDGRVDEYDAIVITVDGIFVVEVKYSACDMVIDRLGNLRSKTRTRHGVYNIGERMQSKEFTLWKILQESELEIDRAQIHGVLLYANNDSDIDDRFGRVKVCRCGDINYYICDYNSSEREVDHESIRRIAEALSQAGTPASFAPDIDLDGLREDFETVLAMIEDRSEKVVSDSNVPDQSEYSTVVQEATRSSRIPISLNREDVIAALLAIGSGIAAGFGIAAFCKQH